MKRTTTTIGAVLTLLIAASPDQAIGSCPISVTLNNPEIILTPNPDIVGNADLNFDGIVDFKDLEIFYTSSTAASIAEPPPEPGPPALKVTQVNHQAWSGLDFEALAPTWDVDTAIVVPPPPPVDPSTGQPFIIGTPFTPTGVYTGGAFAVSGGTSITYGIWQVDHNFGCVVEPPPDPVELLNSTQSAVTFAQATVRAYDKTFSAELSDSDSNADPDLLESEQALIANVFDNTDPGNFLTGAHAWATQTSEIAVTQMTASGSVSTESLLDTGVPDGDANSNAYSTFSSSFRLNESHDFTLDLEVSVTENVSLTVELTDDLNNETLYTAVPADFDQQTGTWEILVEGYLPPGEYTLSAEALSDASVHSNDDVDFGGDAQFDLEFNLTQLSSPITSAFLQANTPEPASLMLLVAAAWPLAFRRRSA